MARNSFTVVVVFAAAAWLTSGSWATGNDAKVTSSTTSFILREFTPTALVDTPPKARGTIDMSPGDTFTAHSTVYDATGKRRLGRTSELCTDTVRNPVTVDCSIALIFRRGDELLLHGAINPTHLPWQAAVVGGYGRYAGVRGWVRESRIAGGERMTLTLTN